MSENLRMWEMSKEAAMYFLPTCTRNANQLRVESVFPVGWRLMVTFRGSYPFIESEVLERFPDTIPDDVAWPKEPRVHK